MSFVSIFADILCHKMIKNPVRRRIEII